MVKLNFIKEVEILSSRFNIEWDKSSDAGSFNWKNSKIVVGIQSYKIDPLYTFNILSHEVMEIILSGLGGRYDSKRIDNDFLFCFKHQTFETAIEIHTQVLSKFIKWQK